VKYVIYTLGRPLRTVSKTLSFANTELGKKKAGPFSDPAFKCLTVCSSFS